MAISKRIFSGPNTQDMGSIDNLTYSDQAGSRKVSVVGTNLIPLGDGAGGFTTLATTARIVVAGSNIAVYNNDTAVHFITLSNSNATTALTNGATNAAGNVAIACPPGAYTYIACYNSNWVIADSNKLYVYAVNDSTSIIPVSANNAST